MDQKRSRFILTFNLKDFPSNLLEPYQIAAEHPDEFVTSLLSFDSALVCLAVKRHRQSLKNPPKTASEYLATIQQQGLPKFVTQLRRFIDLI